MLERRAALRALSAIGLAPGVLGAVKQSSVPALSVQTGGDPEVGCGVPTASEWPWWKTERLEGRDYRIDSLSPHIHCLRSVSPAIKHVLQRAHDDRRRSFREQVEKLMGV